MNHVCAIACISESLVLNVQGHSTISSHFRSSPSGLVWNPLSIQGGACIVAACASLCLAIKEPFLSTGMSVPPLSQALISFQMYFCHDDYVLFHFKVRILFCSLPCNCCLFNTWLSYDRFVWPTTESEDAVSALMCLNLGAQPCNIHINKLYSHSDWLQWCN